MVAKQGVPPVSASPLETNNAYTLMYGSEIGKNKKSWRSVSKKVINSRNRATLGVTPSTLVAFLSAEGGRMPARTRRDHRQEPFAARLCQSSHQQHQQIVVQDTPVSNRHRSAIGLTTVEIGKTEVIRSSRGLCFPASIISPPMDGEQER